MQHARPVTLPAPRSSPGAFCRSRCARPEVVLAYPGTPYGDAFMSVTKAIIEDRLGVPARLLSSSNPVIFKAMDADRGGADVGANAAAQLGQSLVDEYVTRKGHRRPYPQCLAVPARRLHHQAHCREIRHQVDLRHGPAGDASISTAKAGDNKGEYMVGSAEWNSTSIDKARARHYGLTELYNLTTSQADLEYCPASATRSRPATPIFWACDGASNFIFAKDAHRHMLDEPPHDPAKWHPVLRRRKIPTGTTKPKVDTAPGRRSAHHSSMPSICRPISPRSPACSRASSSRRS